MKNLSPLLFVFIILSSCYGTKRATSKKNAPVEISTAPEPSKSTEVIIVKPVEEVPIIVEEIIEIEEIQSETVVEPPIKPQAAFNHSAWNSLLQKYVSDNGNVNYKGFKNESSKLKAYIKLLGENLPTNAWTKEDKLAYWMNAYNALTVDLIVQNYPIKSIKDIDNPWKQRLWKLGSKWYNLDGIEHQILRKMNEPRIHFGIACASYSCPKLLNEAFTASNVEAQFEKATKAFIVDKKHNEISENKLYLSKIFKWFAKDFKQNGTLIDFLNKYTEVKISKNAKKSFKDYNWALNE